MNQSLSVSSAVPEASLKPQISVCIITCNQDRYIRQCVESALAQAVDVSLEILIGDDCSQDDTSSILAGLAAANPRLIKHIRHDPRLGACQNSQSILALAKGQFIAHLDGDDYWLPGKLKEQLTFMLANPDCAGVYTNALTVTEAGDTIGLFNDVGRQRFDLAAMLRKGNFLNTSSIMVRSELVSHIIDIDEPFIDYRAHLRYARNGFLAQLETPMVGYRVSSVGSMVFGSNDLVRQLYWDAIMDVPRDLVTDLDFAQGLADFSRRVAFRAMNTRRWSLLRKWLPLVFKTSPCGKIRTALLILWAIARMAYLEIVGRLPSITGGKRVKVLYRR
ncbi:MAG: glycosyltransferase [Pseudomonadota bacterium]